MDTNKTITSKQGVQKVGNKVTDELPKVKDPNINFRDTLNDALSAEKHILVNYQIAINEIINDDLRGLLIKNRNDLQNVHTRIFDEMFNIGEYQADIATSPQVKDVFDVFSGYKVQLPLQH